MSAAITELRGADAVAYAETHLRKVQVRPDDWEADYIDDATGEEWTMDYPDSHVHGGGSPRLRRRSGPGSGE